MGFDLDDFKVVYSADPGRMADAIMGLPEQCREGYEMGHGLALPSGLGGAKNIVVLGMGGSAIGGDLLRSLTEDELGVPMVVSRDYALPQFVGPDSLVLACSYSGNTEETLTAYQAARKRGARLVAITSGGKLGELAAQEGVPAVTIPKGLSPRAALGYMFMPALTILERLGFIGGKERDCDEMIATLEALRDVLGPRSPFSVNQSKQIAHKMLGKIPIIYGSGGWRGIAAERWKCQINENAKTPAFWNVFPELNHNETVGWECPEAVIHQVEVFVLQDKEDSAKIQKRIEVTEEIMAGKVGGITHVWPMGSSRLARFFSLIYVGDFASLYLAFLNGVDPTPVRVIDLLKKRLEEV